MCGMVSFSLKETKCMGFDFSIGHYRRLKIHRAILSNITFNLDTLMVMFYCPLVTANGFVFCVTKKTY